jgi:hypothetical protein
VQQNYAAIQDYYAKRGTDLSVRSSSINTAQTYNVIVTGSSIDAGTFSTAPYSFMTLGSSYTVNPSAVPGSGTQSHLFSYGSPELFYFNPKAGRNIYFLGAPTNDLCEVAGDVVGGNTTPGVAFSNSIAFANYIHRSQAEGGLGDANGLVILGTMISRVAPATSPNTGQCDTVKNTVNNLFRAATLPANTVIADIAEIPNIGADGAAAGTPGTLATTCPGATTYFNSDCVHPVAAGSTLYGAAMQAVIQANTGFTTAFPNVQTGTTYTMGAGDRSVLFNSTGAATTTLPPCQGLTTYRYDVGSDTSFGVTVSPSGSDTIAGSGTVAAGSTGGFLAMLTSPVTGGCFWRRI